MTSSCFVCNLLSFVGICGNRRAANAGPVPPCFMKVDDDLLDPAAIGFYVLFSQRTSSLS